MTENLDDSTIAQYVQYFEYYINQGDEESALAYAKVMAQNLISLDIQVLGTLPPPPINQPVQLNPPVQQGYCQGGPYGHPGQVYPNMNPGYPAQNQYTQNIVANNPAIRAPSNQAIQNSNIPFQTQGPINIPMLPMYQSNLMQSGPTQMYRVPISGVQSRNLSPNSTFQASVAPIPVTAPGAYRPQQGIRPTMNINLGGQNPQVGLGLNMGQAGTFYNPNVQYRVNSPPGQGNLRK